MKSQPWQERRREYLEKKDKLPRVIDIAVMRKKLSETPRRGISGEVRGAGRPKDGAA